MAKTKISEFSATPGNNTDIDGINIAEGCAPSGINDAIRELMSQLKDFQTGAAGDSFNGPVGTTTAAAGAFTTLSASGAVTLSGGTANGVPYLNGSKVLTTGSALTFDGSNLGLGVTPSAWNSSRKAFQIGQSTALYSFSTSQSILGTNVYMDAGGTDRYLNSAAATQYVQSGGVHSWNIAPSGTAGNAITFTQAMTLDASGNLLVAATNNLLSARLDIYTNSTSNSTNASFRMDRNANVDNAAFFHQYAQSTNSAVQCRFYNASFVGVGTITSSGSATAYNTSSDYRLKENIQPMTGALAKVQALKPVTYKWKSDGSDGEGFIAHELAEVVPQCVAGEKDAVDADGKPVYQGIDTSFLVATLTAAIQELNAKVEAQAAEIAALKGQA